MRRGSGSNLVLLLQKKVPAVPPGPVTLFYDTFTGADGTLLTAHTPDVDLVGGGWVKYTYSVPLDGTMQISGNRATNSTINTLTVYAADVGKSDCVITTTVTTRSLGGDETLPPVRLTDVNNCWFMAFMNDENNLKIFERSSGTVTLRATTAVSIANNETWDLTITLSGTNLTIRAVRGATDVSATYSSSTFATNTKHGIGQFNPGFFDNYKVVG